MATSSFSIEVPSQLLDRARRGEHAAFERIYLVFERPVFTLAMRVCGNREQAQDVLQDTMLKVFAAIGHFEGRDGSPFWGWLRQIAVNEALTRLRRDRKFADEEPLDGQDCLEQDGPLPPAAADAAALQRALAALPPVTRTVLWLYHAEGFTHEEIGGLIQRTASFSKSQLARGLPRLRKLLLEGSRESCHA